MNERRGKRQSGWSIFAMPLLLAVASAVGLVAGLLGEGPYDAIAAIGLFVPIMGLAFHLVKST